MSTRPFAAVFGFDHDDMPAPITNVAVAAVRAGYGVIPVAPSGKRPLCTLSAQALKKANAEAQAAGFRRHACATRHAITDADEARRVFSRLERVHDGQQLNLGIVAWPSRIVSVDCDTAEQVEGFLKDGAEATGDDTWLTRTPTTSSPGQRDGDGSWVHRDGGHFHYLVPDGVELPEYPGEIVGDAGWVAKWSWTQALVPPSKRETGRYTTGADVLEAPDWLMERIWARIDRHRERASRPAVVNDSIAAWSVSQPWADLMLEDGWADAAAVDGCGCPIFTRPGNDVSNRKSATAHADDCPIWENREGHGPLHLWTDNPPAELETLGKRTLTKLEYVVATRFGGDTGLARTTLGIDEPGTDWFEAPTEPEATGTTVPPTTTSSVTSSPDGTSELEEPDDERFRIAAEYGITDKTQLKALLAEVNLRRRREAADAILAYERGIDSVDDWSPDPMLALQALDHLDAGDDELDVMGVLARTDGATLFPRGDLHTLWGQSETGKSWLTCLIIRQVLEAGGRACYFDFEDTALTFFRRMVDIGTVCMRGYVESGALAYVNPSREPTAVAFEQLESYDVVIVDSLSEVIAAMKDPVMTGMVVRRAMRLFRNLAVLGAAVIVIVHETEKSHTDSPMGPSEFKQAVTGQEVKVVNLVPLSPEGGGKSRIYVSKDRKGLSAADVHVDAKRSKSERRLWGELTLDKGDVVDGLLDPDATTIRVSPAIHDARPTKASQVETAIVRWYMEHPGEKQTIDGLTTAIEVDATSRTVRTVAEYLCEQNLIHVCGEKPPSPLGGKPAKLLADGHAEDCPQHPPEVSEGTTDS